MTSDNVFSDWLTSLVTFFDQNVICNAQKVTRVEHNIPTLPLTPQNRNRVSQLS
jgi:hypothetical protein